MSTSLSTMNTSAKLKFFLTFAPILFFLIPTNEIFTSQIRGFIVITVIAIIAFCTESLPQTAVAIAFPFAYIFFNIAPAEIVMSPWTQFVPWITLGGLVMAVILEKTGFLARISYWCIIKTGATYRGIIIGIALAGCLFTSFVDVLVVPFAALTYGVVMALDLKNTPAAAGIVLSGSIGCLVPMCFKFTGPLLAVGVSSKVTGAIPLLGYFETWFYMLPMIFVFVVLIAILAIMFKPSQPISGKQYFKEQLNSLGKMSNDEKKIAAILLMYFLFILFYKFTPFQFNWGLALIPLLMAFPVVGCGNSKDLQKVNFGFVIFVASCMSIGSTAVHLGIGELVGNLALPFLEGKSYYTFFALVWILYFLLNFFMTPLAITAAFTVPFVTIAMQLGINPMAFFFFGITAADQIVLPYEYALYMIGFAFGVMKLKDFVKFMTAKTIVTTIIMFAVCLPWWHFTGFLFS